MKRLVALAAFAFFSQPAFSADKYTFDKSHTAITWSVNHLGFSRPNGKWMDVDGMLTLDEKTPANSKVEAIINVSAMITGVPKLDDHLRSPEFFDTAKYQQAKFVSTSVETTGDKTANVIGDLTLHGVTKPVVLAVTLNKLDTHPMTKKKAVGFSATTTLKRSDFNINYGIPMVADEVQLAIETELAIAE